MRDVQDPSHRRWHVRGLLNGGLELALHDVFGAEPAWFAEFEPPKKPGKKPPRQAASMILAHHWPDVPNHGDVTTIDWSTVEPVDIIAGGSPCQDMSHAGKRAGMRSGTRSGLWASMCDAIDTLRPSLVVWENVHGALSARAASDVEREPGRVGDSKRRPVLRAHGTPNSKRSGTGSCPSRQRLRSGTCWACVSGTRRWGLVPTGHGRDGRHEPCSKMSGASRAKRLTPADEHERNTST